MGWDKVDGWVEGVEGRLGGGGDPNITVSPGPRHSHLSRIGCPAPYFVILLAGGSRELEYG